MNEHSKRAAVRAAVTLLALSAAAAGHAAAQDPPAQAGRLAYAAGSVSLAPAGSADWVQAPLNRPLAAGDRLWTDAGARDEAQFGNALARMDANTLLTVLAADGRTTQLQLAQGRIDLHVRALAAGDTVEVDTPNLAFVARAPGDYRIAVAPDGSTTDVAVLRGAADAYGDGTTLALAPDRGYRFGGQDLNNYVILGRPVPDDFERWAAQRDQRYDAAVARRYVPAGVVGVEDLDGYGAWRDVPDYGEVWVPTRAPQGWAPYHDGHWAWVDPWGWTWIDDQPWGYAVSHYGRWVHVRDDWAWVPAPRAARPVYAPALVAFVGATLAAGAFNGPGVGWFPLGPHEPYRPPYRASPNYIVNVNIGNTVFRDRDVGRAVRDAPNWRYQNRGVPGAMVALPAQQFGQGGAGRHGGMALPAAVAQGAAIVAGPGARPPAQARGPAGHPPPAPAQGRVGLARALPGAAFAHPGGVALAGHGAQGGPVRMLRPAVGRQVTPQPQRGTGPGQFAQGAGRPGTPAQAAAGARPGAPVQGLIGAQGRGPEGAHGVPGRPAGVAEPGRAFGTPAGFPEPGRPFGPAGAGHEGAQHPLPAGQPGAAPVAGRENGQSRPGAAAAQPAPGAHGTFAGQPGGRPDVPGGADAQRREAAQAAHTAQAAQAARQAAAEAQRHGPGPQAAGAAANGAPARHGADLAAHHDAQPGPQHGAGFAAQQRGPAAAPHEAHPVPQQAMHAQPEHRGASPQVQQHAAAQEARRPDVQMAAHRPEPQQHHEAAPLVQQHHEAPPPAQHAPAAPHPAPAEHHQEAPHPQGGNHDEHHH